MRAWSEEHEAEFADPCACVFEREERGTGLVAGFGCGLVPERVAYGGELLVIELRCSAQNKTLRLRGGRVGGLKRP